MKYTPIGRIHTPYRLGDEVPRQAALSETEGLIEVYPEYAEGLKDLEGFTHIIVLYLFDKIRGYDLTVTTPWDEKQRGLFATRAPRRPNPIGISTVEIKEIKENKIKIKGVDMLDQTPLLDIKPYIPEIDERKNTKTGWIEDKIQKK
ncbi:MAG: tRNA (N6-threonylcarbamoyladenosine(37)-N6)-methyltransferase TrmO [Candidatus Altiarchaeota archaeon]|nr:tRNA (N6-threonylcarbamoyladenosine(37)-N6)-methyltransferase TrmO [Candidatus Altiarchaeota archaeon]